MARGRGGGSDRNWDILLQVGQFFKLLRIPWIVCGDFSTALGIFVGSMWGQFFGGRVISTGEAIFHCKGGGSELDFLVAQTDVDSLVTSCQRDIVSPIKVHDVVALGVIREPAKHHKLIQKGPRTFPKGIPPWAQPMIPRPGNLITNLVDTLVRNQNSLDLHFSSWIGQAEKELCETFQLSPKKPSICWTC